METKLYIVQNSFIKKIPNEILEVANHEYYKYVKCQYQLLHILGFTK
jgi:hypothetical protein